MGFSRRFYVTACSALVVTLLLLVNTLNVTISNALSPYQLYYRATVKKTEPAFTSSSDHEVINESRDTRNTRLMVRDIYVNGHERPHPELCNSTNSNVHIVILVTSAPSHSDARNTIRRNWKQYAPQAGVAFAFMLGVPDQDLLPSIEAEDEQHGDIVMGRFVDSYSNLTLKTLSMLEWVETYCQQASYLLKTDDDMKIYVDRLLEFTESVIVPRTMWGRLWRGAQPIRTTAAKYYMPSLQFPRKRYPDYLSGEAYMMTTDCVPLLLEEAMRQPYLRLEDVFITGVLASRQSIRRVHIERFIGNIAEHVLPTNV